MSPCIKLKNIVLSMINSITSWVTIVGTTIKTQSDLKSHKKLFFEVELSEHLT